MLYSLTLTISLIILSGTTCFGQLAVKKIINKDDLSAKEIYDSIIEPCVPSTGTISTYWYKYIPEKDTLLIFDIVPIDPKHDYDFVLYKCEKENGAADNKKQKLKPVRYCIGANFTHSGPIGLSLSATKDSLITPYNYGHVSPFRIKAGETYYIMVNWKYDNSWQKGFKIYLYNYWPKKPKRLMSKPTVTPKEIVLENVLFETNKSTLLKESYAPLDSLVRLLASQKTMCIDIKGHTDNVGDETKNQDLSEKRAKAVFEYLVSKKIAQNRLSYHGLGSKEPISSNETEEGRRKNRRVAFIVITK